MFLLVKLISRLLFPVPIVIVIIITGMILLRSKQRRRGFCICTAGMVLLILASIHPVADSLLWTLEGRYQPLVTASPELKSTIGFIVVLGSGHGDRFELSDTARLSSSATGRVTEAVRLSREFPGIPVVFTGGMVGGKMAIGDAASRAARAYGLSPARIIVEGNALNTEGEARAVLSMAANKTILLVTSASHMRRAMGLFRSAGIRAVPAPADYRAMGGPYSPWDYVPCAEALQKTERAWYEYMGLAWNAIRVIIMKI